MKQLILMRHSQAQPAQGILNDRERPLTIDGLEDLQVMRLKLQGHLKGLNHVLCSNVKRTRQTLEGLKPVLPTQCTTAFADRLYHASVQDLVEHMKSVEATTNFIMIIAHNPGVSEFLHAVVSSTQESSGMHRSFPPCAAAIFEGNFNDWLQAAPARFLLKTFLKP